MIRRTLPLLLAALLATGCGNPLDHPVNTPRAQELLAGWEETLTRSVPGVPSLRDLKWRDVTQGLTVDPHAIFLTGTSGELVLARPVGAFEAAFVKGVRDGRLVGYTATPTEIRIAIGANTLYPFRAESWGLRDRTRSATVVEVRGACLVSTSYSLVRERFAGLTPRIWEPSPSPSGAPPRGLGFRGRALSDLSADVLARLPGVRRGVYVSAVFPGTPAGQAGLRAGDVIVECDQKPINGPPDLMKALDAARTRPAVKLAALRGGKPISLIMPLAPAR